jgi:pilus assembly protein CpaB
MTNRKALLPIVLSLVIAAGGTYFLYTWMQKQAPKQAVVMTDVQAVPVAVAAVDLAWGTKLTPEMIKTTPFMKESLPSGAFDTIDKVKGRVVIASLKAGDPIVEHRLAPETIQTGGVSAVVTQGKRAIAVKGDSVIGLAGFINPGNRVDVLVTMQDPEEKIDRTRVILQDIPVLATGTQIQKNDKGEPAPVDVYTLEMTPEESEKLALAAAEGRLQFALRNAIDTGAVETPGTTIAETLGTAAVKADPTPAPLVEAPAPRRPRVAVAERPGHTVEVIRGTAVTREKYPL